MIRLVADARETLAQGDESLTVFTQSVDEYVRDRGLDAPEESLDAVPDPAAVTDPLLELDLHTAGITSIVWATGYRADYSWLSLPIFDEHDQPMHRRGVTDVPGLYFLGLHWQHKLKSGFIWGVGEDAAYLAEQIAARH